MHSDTEKKTMLFEKIEWVLGNIILPAGVIWIAAAGQWGTPVGIIFICVAAFFCGTDTVYVTEAAILLLAITVMPHSEDIEEDGETAEDIIGEIADEMRQGVPVAIALLYLSAATGSNVLGDPATPVSDVSIRLPENPDSPVPLHSCNFMYLAFSMPWQRNLG